MKKLLSFVACGLIFVGCGEEKSGSSASGSSGGSPVTAPVDYVASAAKAQQSAIKATDLAALNQAVQLFYAQENRFPKDLNELVPNYVGKIPPTPVGTKLDYDPATGKVGIVKQ